MTITPPPTTNPAFFLGIDVGKADLFCHILSPDGHLSDRFDNTPPGILMLTRWVTERTDLAATVACLEQTGHYGKPVAKALHDLKLHALHLVNPRRIKAFAHQKLRRNKSDSADARLIAQFVRAEHHDIEPWRPRSPEHETVAELSRYAESLTSDTARLKTKCEAVSNPAILRSLTRRIKSQTKEIADTRKRINAIVASSRSMSNQRELLASIPGLGEVTCQIVIAELPEISLFSSARQLAAWAGLTPRHFVSGTSGSTRTPITKVGSANLRRALFMPAMNARVFNPLLKTFADRLKENGKSPKQIIIAVMRKLLHQIFGILKSNQPFNPEKRGLFAPS